MKLTQKQISGNETEASKYYETVEIDRIEYRTDSYYTSNTFLNPVIVAKGGFKKNESYYFKIPVCVNYATDANSVDYDLYSRQKSNPSLKFSINFYNTDNQNRGSGDILQQIKIVELETYVFKNNNKDIKMLEFIATPMVDMVGICFVITRVAHDVLGTQKDFDNSKGVQGRVFKFDSCLNTYRAEKIGDLKNKITIKHLKNPVLTNKDKVKKVSIQGKPGTFMAINGEQIRIGKRGIYEALNDIVIDSFYILPEDGGRYIIDYQS